MASDVEHLFVCLWVSLYVLLGGVFIQVLGSYFNWVVCLPGVDLCEFFLCFGDQTIVQGIIGKYIFLYGGVPFHFANAFFSHAEAFYFDVVTFIIYFISLAIEDL